MYRICHHVLLPKDDVKMPYSNFQGFSRSLIENLTNIFAKISQSPKSIYDVFLPTDELHTFRATQGLLSCIVISVSTIHEDIPLFSHPFNCIWSFEKISAYAEFYANRFDFEPIIVSDEPMNSYHLTYEKLNNSNWADLLTPWLAKLAKSIPSLKIQTTILELMKFPLPSNKKNKIEFKLLAHNSLIPSARVLESLDFQIGDGIPSQLKKTKEYMESIQNACKAIDGVRNKLRISNEHFIHDAIIYCPSIYAHLFANPDSFIKKLGTVLNADEQKIFDMGILRNKGYSNFIIEVADDFKLQDSVILPFIIERKKELLLFSELISILAVSQAAPPIRFPNSVMLHQPILKKIATLIKNGHEKKPRKLRMAMKKFADEINAELGPEFLNISFKDRNKLLAICDFPIEWLRFNQIPIMFSHEISRVCSTPGNLLIDTLLCQPKIEMALSKLQKVCIIQSFLPNDPIRNYIKIALDSMPVNQQSSDLNVSLHEVSSSAEVFEILNNFDGGIVVFDCHGSHGGADQPAYLKICDERFIPWDIDQHCILPPIVILSACSTHPIDGSHASVANGFLKSGAMTVLGTYANISAHHSTRFLGRLLHRIRDYVPFAVQNEGVSWRKIMSDFLKMCYSSDILGILFEKKYIDSKTCDQLQFYSNVKINSFSKEWPKCFFEKIVETSGIKREVFQRFLDEEFLFTQTMLYSQLGRPECIFVVP